MANPITNLSSAPGHLIPGAMGIMMHYDQYPAEWKPIYTIVNSMKNYELYYEDEAINAAGEFDDGAHIPMGAEKQVFTTYGYNKNVGVGFSITSNMIADNLYPDQFPKGVLGMKENLRTFKEYRGIAPFDNAFTATSKSYILGDGQPLCSSAHPISTGTLSNVLNNAQLSETSYQDLIMLVQQFQDYSGQPRCILPTHLLVGIPNQFIASVVTRSTYDPTNANNGINPLLHDGYIKGSYLLNHFMSNSYNCFLLTNYKDGAIYQNRQNLEIETFVDQSNRNLSLYACERYCFVFPNFRCVAGMQSF